MAACGSWLVGLILLQSARHPVIDAETGHVTYQLPSFYKVKTDSEKPLNLLKNSIFAEHEIVSHFRNYLDSAFHTRLPALHHSRKCNALVLSARRQGSHAQPHSAHILAAFALPPGLNCAWSAICRQYQNVSPYFQASRSHVSKRKLLLN